MNRRSFIRGLAQITVAAATLPVITKLNAAMPMVYSNTLTDEEVKIYRECVVISDDGNTFSVYDKDGVLRVRFGSL